MAKNVRIWGNKNELQGTDLLFEGDATYDQVKFKLVEARAKGYQGFLVDANKKEMWRSNLAPQLKQAWRFWAIYD